MITMDGNVYHSWPARIGKYIYMVKPLDNGNIMVNESARRILELDWNNNVVWEYNLPTGTSCHHDFQRLPNGTTLVAEGMTGRILEKIVAVTSGGSKWLMGKPMRPHLLKPK